MSDDVTKKVIPHPAWRRLPEWFEAILNDGAEVDEDGKPILKKKPDPRQVGPAAQQEKKPL